MCSTLKFSQIDVKFLTLYWYIIWKFFFHDTHQFNINNNNNNNNNDNDEKNPFEGL